MAFLIALTYLNTSWSQGYFIKAKYTGFNKGTWELQNPQAVPWGLLALDTKGTFGVNVAQKTMEFWSHDKRDSAGVRTLSFAFFDAPKSQWDQDAKGSDGLIYTTANPAGEECDLNWSRWC